MSLKSIEALAGTTKGFLQMEEGTRLFHLAKEASLLGPCLEIGSYCGKSTLFIGGGCKENDSILFSIDHHYGSEEQQPGEAYFDPDLLDPAMGRLNTFNYFRSTLSNGGLEDIVVPMVCPSHVASRAWSIPLAMVFIDGGHALETVLQDYRCWSGHIVSGGFLVFHDIYPDPADGGQAPYQVYQQALASGLFQARAMTGSLGVLERVSSG